MCSFYSNTTLFKILGFPDNPETNERFLLRRQGELVIRLYSAILFPSLAILNPALLFQAHSSVFLQHRPIV